MKKRSFGEFVDKKKRECLRQLKLVKQLLESSGLKVENFLDTDDKDDPYIFCFMPTKNGSFDGIRIYRIGEEIAFRIQKENKTHPYGSAYPLPIEEMFHDFLSDEDADQKKAGEKVIKSVVKEIRRFFDKSVEAEREERERDIEQEKDTEGNVLVRTTGTDYSSLVYNKA
tara:strand:+ start:31 stop:540 length:510 start_codon:yes stop_codon:yes gene_type:complete